MRKINQKQNVLAGSLAVDQIMVFDGLFEEMIQIDKVHALSISVLIDRLQHTRGGIAGNIAYSLALLGETPILYASVGKDQTAYMKDLESQGVNIDYLHYSDLPTASFSVITDKNDCQVGGFYPGAMGDASTLTLEPFQNQDVLTVISSHDPAQMEAQIEYCLANKKLLFFDIGQQVIALPVSVLKKGVEAASILILNDYEMGVLAKRTNQTIDQIKKKVDVCVVTLGAKGCKIYAKENQWEEQSISAVPVEKIVDPTGAGDAFRGGFLFGFVRGWPHSQSAELGATVASFAVEKHGTQEHSPSVAEIKSRHKKQYQQEIHI